MIARDRVIRALNHQSIDHAPRDLWLAPGLEAAQPDGLAEINVRFPSDFLHLDASPHPGKRPKTHGHKAGTHTDAWGCVWKADSPDDVPLLVVSPLAGSSSLASFDLPVELLEAARFAKVNPVCEGTAKFTLAASAVHPLERLWQLRGEQTAMREVAEGHVEVRNLLGRLHDMLRREIELWAKTQIDGVALGDDLSWAVQSPVNLQLWRSIVKPVFRDCCKILHERDKFAFFLAHGPLGNVLDDLIEIEIDAVHAEWPLEEFVKLAAKQRGRIVFWGGVENRRMEPPILPVDIRDTVFRIRKAADFGAGGVISQISWTKDMPLRNIAAYFEQWLVPLPVAV